MISALRRGAVGEDHADVVGVADHVIVGDDDARRIDHEAGAERIRAALALRRAVAAAAAPGPGRDG